MAHGVCMYTQPMGIYRMPHRSHDANDWFTAKWPLFS